MARYGHEGSVGGGHVSDKGWEECSSDFLLVGRAQLKFYFLKKKIGRKLETT
jgi:hypothetical protein